MPFTKVKKDSRIQTVYHEKTDDNLDLTTLGSFSTVGGYKRVKTRQNESEVSQKIRQAERKRKEIYWRCVGRESIKERVRCEGGVGLYV